MPHLIINSENSGIRLDSFLAKMEPNQSRSAVSRWIKENRVFVNGKTSKASYLTEEGDTIDFESPTPRPSGVEPQEIALNIIFEDQDMLVINKPKGMVTHPAPGSPDHTLVNAILAHCPNTLSGIGGVERPGIVHRLDKDTSGLIMVAKNDAAHRNLSEQIATREAKRKYLALVWGNPGFEKARVEAPIKRHPVDRQRYTVAKFSDDSGAREAITELTVIERFEEITLLEASLQTGRTHQIRVHCQYIEFPVVGDPVYGRRSTPKVKSHVLQSLLARVESQLLHAYSLAFNHPRTGEKMEFTVQPPKEFTEVLQELRNRES